MRTKDIIEKRATAVLDAPEQSSARERRWTRPDPLRPRRELVEDFADDEDTAAFLRSSGRDKRLRRSLIPQTKWGRIAAASALAVVFACVAGVLWSVSHFLSRDARFRIASSQAIEIQGNTHVTRSQMLSIFGEDIDRNIFHVPMSQRRTELEHMPWVEHASVMRLLPNRIRVQVVERTPVAFVRQGGTIGLVDASGVLLDIPPDAPGNPNYSFPVVTGIVANEPLSTRAARMKVYTRFMRDLDSGGSKVSSEISEVDLSDPEDVRALIPDHNSEVLVHFGDDNFLDRYRRMKDHMAEWRSQYPRLASVDMRYERQVVLQMPQGATAAALETPVNAASNATPKVKPEAPAPAAIVGKKPVAPSPAKPSAATAAKPPVPATKSIADSPKAAAHGKPSAGPPKPAQNAVAVSVKPAGQTDAAKEAEMQRKVAAIHEWMAKREKLRQQKAAHPPASTVPAAAKPGVQYHPSQVE